MTVQAVVLVVLCWACAGSSANEHSQRTPCAKCQSLHSIDDLRELHAIRNFRVRDELWHSRLSLKALAKLFLALNPTTAWQILSAGTSHGSALDNRAGSQRPMPPQVLARIPSRATKPCMDILAWQKGASRELNMLPFGMYDALLPGDTKQVHLFEERMVQLFLDTEQNDERCLCQLLITQDNEIEPYTSLLVIEESQIEDVGVWARLRCVGRVRIVDVGMTNSYCRGAVSLVTDEFSQPVNAVLVEDCMKAHSRCRELNQKMERIRLGEEKSRIKAMLNGLNVPEEKVLMGHEESKTAEFDKDLKKLCDARRDQLRSLTNDTAPAEGLGEWLQRLWGASNEMEAEQQLLGFTAAAFLPPIARMQVLQATNPSKRLETVVKYLEESEKRTAAELALAEVSPPKQEEW